MLFLSQFKHFFSLSSIKYFFLSSVYLKNVSVFTFSYSFILIFVIFLTREKKDDCLVVLVGF